LGDRRRLSRLPLQDIRPGRSSFTAPIEDELKARTEWQRLTFRDRCGAPTRYSICVEPSATVSDVLDRPRIVAETVRCRGADEVLTDARSTSSRAA
jgi:hypothetical protein